MARGAGVSAEKVVKNIRRKTRRPMLGAVQQPLGLSENPASLAGLPIHRPIVGQSAEIASSRDDLIDRHRGLAIQRLRESLS
jgi:hypothetical protein